MSVLPHGSWDVSVIEAKIKALEAQLKPCPLCGEPECTKLCLDEQEREDEYRRQCELDFAYEDELDVKADEAADRAKEGW